MTKHRATNANNPGKAAGPAETTLSSTGTEDEAGEYPSFTEIKELIEFVSKKEFNEFELERGPFRMRWRKGSGEPAPASISTAAQASQLAGENRLIEYAHTPTAPAQPAPVPQEEKLHIVASPIVGTFYRAASPTAEPFVKLGDKIETGKTLCIIEAMKLMNDITADVGGTIAKVFVENGQPVEYGQALFGIKV
jgi:acetyl-CoA carboxylase biotin carboxyl carrier protein